MNKWVAFIFLLYFSIAFSQQRDNYVSFAGGIDPRNGSIGSTPTNSEPALNYVLQAAVVYENIEVGLGYEVFERLDFSKYGLNLAYHFPLYGYPLGYEIKTTFIPGLEPCFISRYRNWGGGLGSEFDNKTYLSIGLNLALRWNLNKKWSLEYVFNVLPRTDLKDKFPEDNWYGSAKVAGTPLVGTGFIKLFYRIEY